MDITTQREAKRQAALCLAQNFARSLIVALLHGLPLMLISVGMQAYLTAHQASLEYQQLLFVTLVALLLQGIVAAPLDFGLYRYYTAKMHHTGEGMSVIFEAFSSMRSMGKSFRMTIALWARLFMLGVIPTALLFGAAFLLPDSTSETVIWLCISLYSIVMVPIYCKYRSYQAGYVLMHEDESMGAWQVTKQASKVFRGKLTAILVFELSFLLWYILGIFSCGVLLLFVKMYEGFAFVSYFDRLRGKETQPFEPPVRPM